MTIFRPAALGSLEAAAVQSAVAERDLRENFAREIERLERERQRAWRRFNFLGALVAADASTGDREASRAAQARSAIDELGWSGADPELDAILEAMTPLADAVHDERLLLAAEAEAAAQTQAQEEVQLVSTAEENAAAARAPAILFALATFEERYEQLKGRPFAAQFDRAFAETPLVDF